MKSLFVLALIALCPVFLLGQAAPSTPTPAPAAHEHHASNGMMEMHHHMQSMQDEAAKMRATLEKMKANLNKISDPTLKQQAQYDADLWEAMVEHTENMAKMMKSHEGMGMMGGMGMQNHPSMPDDKAPAPEKK